MLRKLSSFLPSNIIKFLYNTLIVPHITYAIEAWYGAPEYIGNKVFICQKKAIRIIQSLAYNSSTHSHFKSLGLLKVPDLYKLQVAVRIFSYIRGNCPSPFDFITHSQQHDYNTRIRDSLSAPQVYKSKSKSSFKYRGIGIWNSIPDQIKESSNVRIFKGRYKNFLLSLY